MGFASGLLPSFTVPPEEVEAARIVHGSCRKPHGEGADMLASLDRYRRSAGHHADMSKRPHLLLLTGDQIYADDVDPILLRVIHDASSTLLEWDETFEKTGPGTQGPSTAIQEVRDAATPLVAAANGQALATLPNLEVRIAEALDDMEFSDSWAEDFVIKRLLRRQLARFREEVQRAINAASGLVNDGIKAVAQALLDWLERNAEIFDHISSGHHWGRIAIAATGDDEQVIRELRTELQPLVDDPTKTPKNISTALKQKSEVASSHELRRILDTLAADLGALADTAPRQQIAALTDPLLTVLGPVGGEPEFPDRLGYIPSRISPPQRLKELKDFAALTSNEMTAHLMFFGEFLLMYVFDLVACGVAAPPGRHARAAGVLRRRAELREDWRARTCGARGSRKGAEEVCRRSSRRAPGARQRPDADDLRRPRGVGRLESQRGLGRDGQRLDDGPADSAQCAGGLRHLP